MKKKMVVIGIIMNCAGSEKSFLSFINCINFDEYDVDLLLAKKEGLLLDLIPKKVNVIEMEQYGEMFLLSGANAAKTLVKCFAKKSPLVYFEILPYFLKIIFSPKTKSFTATKLWCHMLQKFPECNKEYDIALAYWGDRTMFYMCDKVKAKKKIAWLHFDYSNPPRDDSIYLNYFNQCNNIVTVSSNIDKALKLKLPQIADKCVMMENINNPKLIWDLALQGDTFKDSHFNGKRILTIGRISEQKGYDFVVPVLAELRKDGYNVRWYIIGDGDKVDKDKLIEFAVDRGVADLLIFLGTTVNPYSYLRDCDIYAQPSRHEGKPIAVEEAKILFKPILVSNYLSASEQLNNGEYGIITDISCDGIFDGIKKLLDNPVLCDEFTIKLSKINFGNQDEMKKFYDMTKN